MIDLFFFRNLFSENEKWYLVIFYVIVSIILLFGNLILLALKLFNGLFRIMVGSDK